MLQGAMMDGSQKISQSHVDMISCLVARELSKLCFVSHNDD